MHDTQKRCYSDQSCTMHSMDPNGFSEPKHVVRKQAGWCNDWSIRSLSTTSVATKLERGGNFLHQCLAPGCSQRCRARQGMAEQGRLHQEKDNHIIPYRTERTWHLQWNILDSMTLNVFQSVTFLHPQKLQNIVQCSALDFAHLANLDNKISHEAFLKTHPWDR